MRQHCHGLPEGCQEPGEEYELTDEDLAHLHAGQGPRIPKSVVLGPPPGQKLPAFIPLIGSINGLGAIPIVGPLVAALNEYHIL